MKYVHTKVVDDLIHYKCMCLLNKTRRGINYVDSLIHQSPSCVTSKEKGQFLPLEIWEMILNFAIGKPRKDKYTLVLPLRVEPDSSAGGDPNGKVLVCEEYEQRDRCGDMGGWAHHYADILHNPGAEEETKRWFPHELPQATGTFFRIDLMNLASQPRHKFLFHSLRQEDLIAWLDRGKCGFCGGDRELYTGCGGWVNEIMGGREPDCGCVVPCPICIGSEYTSKGLDLAHLQQHLHDDLGLDSKDYENEQNRLVRKGWEKLRERVIARKKKLGYL